MELDCIKIFQAMRKEVNMGRGFLSLGLFLRRWILASRKWIFTILQMLFGGFG